MRVLFSLFVTILFASSVFAETDIKPFVPQNRWAMIVGVSHYSDSIGALRYTAKESKDFANSLQTTLGFQPENIKLLNDDGLAPTSANIFSSLDSLLSDKRLDKANLFIFYFSGHGVGTPSGDYLLPIDAKKGHFEENGIPVKDVINRVVRAGLKNVLFIADACRAGNENAFGEELTALCHQANIAVILGCAPGKRSYEYPSLKQGAFTHFLLEALTNSALRDDSGSLWASKLGETVQKQVQDFTAIDHGKYAQVPALWGEQTTLDVLLATFPKKTISDHDIQAFHDKAQALNKKEYSSALTDFASGLITQDRYDQCIDLLKTVDHLGEITPYSQYLLGSSLMLVGRVGEAERIFQRFAKDPPGYYRDLSLASSCSKQLAPSIRIEAALRLLKQDPSWGLKMFGMSVIDQWGTHEERLAGVKILARAPHQTARQKAYSLGLQSTLTGRWKDAISYFESSATSPGTEPSNELLFYARFLSIAALGDSAKLDQFLEEGLSHEYSAGFCYLERAQVAKSAGDLNGRLSNLKIALSKQLDPTKVWLAVRIAGPYIGSLVDDFKSAASKHPYSWRCRMVMSIIKKIQGDEQGTIDDALAADRYMDDPLNFTSTYFEFMDSFMTEAVKLGTLKPEVYRAQLEYYFIKLLEYPDAFGYDADLWMQFAQFGMYCERTEQVHQILSKKLRFSPSQAPISLRPILMLLAMDRGDSEIVEKIYRSNFEAVERQDPSWYYAMYLVTQGKAKEAIQVIKNLAPPSSDIRPVSEALRTYLMATTGRRDEAMKRLAEAPANEVVLCLQGLTWAALGDWNKAEPMLLSQAKIRYWTYLFIQDYGMRVLDRHYRITGKQAESHSLTTLAVISQPGNPLFRSYTYAEKPGLDQFWGQADLKGLAIDDRLVVKTYGVSPESTYSEGTLTFTVDKASKIRGSFKALDTKSAVTFEGSVDRLGNVDGIGSYQGRTLRLSGKIAPIALYKTDHDLLTIGQLFQLIDEHGYRIALLGRYQS